MDSQFPHSLHVEKNPCVSSDEEIRLGKETYWKEKKKDVIVNQPVHLPMPYRRSIPFGHTTDDVRTLVEACWG